MAAGRDDPRTLCLPGERTGGLHPGLDPKDDGRLLKTDSRQDDFPALDRIRSLAVSALDRRKHTSSGRQNAGGALLDLLKGEESAETESDGSGIRGWLEEAVSELTEVERLLREVHRPLDDSAGVVVRHPNRADDAPPSSAGR